MKPQEKHAFLSALYAAHRTDLVRAYLIRWSHSSSDYQYQTIILDTEEAAERGFKDAQEVIDLYKVNLVKQRLTS